MTEKGFMCVCLSGPHWGWRAPFVVVAVPTCGLAVLAWYTIPEPKRGITEKALQVQALRIHTIQLA